MPRIFNKTHYKLPQIYDTDDLFVSHNNANDFSMQIAQLQCIPVASCSTDSATAAKVATVVSDSIGLFTIKDETDSTVYLLGRLVTVSFTKANSATSMTLNIGGTGAYPVTTHGVAVGSGAIGAGNYTFRLMPYGSSYSWDCVDNNGIISVGSDKITYWDGSTGYTATQVNSALANYTKNATSLEIATGKSCTIKGISAFYYNLLSIARSSSSQNGLYMIALNDYVTLKANSNITVTSNGDGTYTVTNSTGNTVAITVFSFIGANITITLNS